MIHIDKLYALATFRKCFLVACVGIVNLLLVIFVAKQDGVTTTQLITFASISIVCFALVALMAFINDTYYDILQSLTKHEKGIVDE